MSILTRKSVEKHKQLLPSFYDVSDDSNITKHITILASQHTKLEEQIFIVKLSNQIQRPITIQKIQKDFFNETLIFRVTLQDIQKVTIQNITSDTVVHEHVFEETGNNYFEYETSIKDTSHPIPNTQFLITVTTFDGYILEKGYPENDARENNAYDHDYALDKIGALYNIPRYTHVAPSVSKYEKTIPPFHVKSTEDDYYYMQRILTYIQNYNKIPLPILELWKYYGVYAELVNRKIMIHEQNVHDMQQPWSITDTGLPVYMKTKYWYNSCAYDIYVEYEKFPSNLTLPTTRDIEEIFTNNLPITKVSQYNINVNIIESRDLELTDSFKVKIGDLILLDGDAYQAERNYYTVYCSDLNLDAETGDLVLTDETEEDADYIVVMDDKFNLWLIDSEYHDDATLELDTEAGELIVTIDGE